MRLAALLVLIAALSTGCSRDWSQWCDSTAKGRGTNAAEVCIRGGSFHMGHDPLEKPEKTAGFVQMPANDWAPRHAVTLRPYFIDKFEVTWGRYRKCVAAGICSRQGIDRIPETRSALDNPSMDELPVDNATWDDALTFCLWDGKRLPTEAEWEHAARQDDDSDFPWGKPTSAPPVTANRRAYVGSMHPNAVGTDAQDVSRAGVHDLYGSVDEWVADFYDPDSYQNAPDEQPTGPKQPVFVQRLHPYRGSNFVISNCDRVVRGAGNLINAGDGWRATSTATPSWVRGHRAPGAGAGFRCARDGSQDSRQKVSNYRPITWTHARNRGRP